MALALMSALTARTELPADAPVAAIEYCNDMDIVASALDTVSSQQSFLDMSVQLGELFCYYSRTDDRINSQLISELNEHTIKAMTQLVYANLRLGGTDISSPETVAQVEEQMQPYVKGLEEGTQDSRTLGQYSRLVFDHYECEVDCDPTVKYVSPKTRPCRCTRTVPDYFLCNCLKTGQKHSEYCTCGTKEVADVPAPNPDKPQGPGKKPDQTPGKKLDQTPGKKPGQTPGKKPDQTPGRKPKSGTTTTTGESEGPATETISGSYTIAQHSQSCTPPAGSKPEILKSGVDVSQFGESDLAAFLRIYQQLTDDMEAAKSLAEAKSIMSAAEKKLNYFMQSNEQLHNPGRVALVQVLMYCAPRAARAQYRLSGMDTAIDLIDMVINTPAKGKTPLENEMLPKIRKIMPMLESKMRDAANNSATLGQFLRVGMMTVAQSMEAELKPLLNIQR